MPRFLESPILKRPAFLVPYRPRDNTKKTLRTSRQPLHAEAEALLDSACLGDIIEQVPSYGCFQEEEEEELLGKECEPYLEYMLNEVGPISPLSVQDSDDDAQVEYNMHQFPAASTSLPVVPAENPTPGPIRCTWNEILALADLPRIQNLNSGFHVWLIQESFLEAYDLTVEEIAADGGSTLHVESDGNLFAKFIFVFMRNILDLCSEDRKLRMKRCLLYLNQEATSMLMGLPVQDAALFHSIKNAFANYLGISVKKSFRQDSIFSMNCQLFLERHRNPPAFVHHAP